jgi:hypothetical protein
MHLFLKTLCGVGIAAAGFIGCSQMSSQQPTASNETQPGGTVLFKMAAGPNTIFGKIAKTVTLTISAPDMLTMTKTLIKTDTSVTGMVNGIPAGKSRLFQVDVYDSANTKEYSGSATSDVAAGETTQVDIIVKRIAGGAEINGLVDEGGDGQTILFSCGPNTGNANMLCIMRPDASNIDTIYQSSKNICAAEFSPDMSHIAFCSNESATGNNDLYLMKSDGSGKAKLTSTTTAAGAYCCHFLSNAKLRFSQEVGYHDSRIYEIGTDSTGYRQVSTMGGQQGNFGLWGTAMYLSRSQSGNANSTEIYATDTACTSPAAITSYSLATYFCDVSPDGMKIITTHHDSYGTLPDNLYAMDNNGANEAKLTTISGVGGQAAFGQCSSGGTQIVYCAYSALQWDVWIMKADGSGALQLTNSPSLNEVVYDWR